jgi:hypothetical protein
VVVVFVHIFFVLEFSVRLHSSHFICIFHKVLIKVYAFKQLSDENHFSV